WPLTTSMCALRIACCSIFLGFALVASAAGLGMGTHSSHQGPRDCGDVYISGGQLEGFYAVYPNNSNPDEAGLIFCGVRDGMYLRNTSDPRTHAKNCQDLKDGGMLESGINVIYPYANHPESPVIVYCEQSILNGGWTVFQRRDDYSTQLDFYKSFDEYALGFGNVGTEFYLGNEILYELTQQSVDELYVDLTSSDGENKYALYNTFDVGSRSGIDGPFQLTIAHYSGTAGDALTHHNGMFFTTFDQDNDVLSIANCAASCHGAWWYRDCAGPHGANLNGIHYNDGTDSTQSAYWGSFSNSREALNRITMMTRPLKQQ
ncbi:unnamed protein product, partial [Meganyctiphanes norvegica]